jgi:hypothetical protein
MAGKLEESPMFRGEIDGSEMLQWVVAAAAFVLSGALAWDGFATALQSGVEQVLRGTGLY